jgi:iron(III) transport system substrate-binding protein
MDQVIAGEYQVGVQTLTHHAAFSSARGAPVEWVAPDDAMGAMLILGLFKGPHPNAGKLLIDFLMSDEGQTIFREADYIPASPNVDARQARLKPDGVNLKARFFPTEELDANQAKWMKIYQDVLK